MTPTEQALHRLLSNMNKSAARQRSFDATPEGKIATAARKRAAEQKAAERADFIARRAAHTQSRRRG